MKITIMEHRQWLRRTHDGLVVLFGRGVTHIRIRPSKKTKDNWNDYTQIEINYAIQKQLEKEQPWMRNGG